MSQQTSPFLDSKFGWNLGESGWNSGMDENLLKFSYLFDKTVNGVVSTLPAPSNGSAYFYTVENKFYYVVNNAYYTSPCPKWFVFFDRSTGNSYQFNGTSAVSIKSPTQLQNDIDSLQSDFASLGTAAFQDSTAFTTPSDLASAITASSSYSRSALSSSASTLKKMQDTTSLNIWEDQFVSLVTNKPNPNDPNTWDWTPALQAMVDLAGPSFVSGVAPNEPRLRIELSAGIFHITKVSGLWKVDLEGKGAVLRPFDATATQPYLLQFAGFCKTYNLTIDMNYAMNYATAIQVRGRHCHFIGVSTWKARCAWIFGDPAWATTPSQGGLGDSENILTSCETVWSITAVKAYGLNTILNFNDCLMYSFKDTLPVGDPRKAAWDALQEITFYNWGALIKLNGGDTANYTGAVPLLRSELQPVSGDPAYSSSFGKFFLENMYIETGWLFECGPVGSYSAQDTRSRVLSLDNCTGYCSTTSGHFISVGGDCQQSVVISHCNFYGQTNNNIIYSLASDTYIDNHSFANISVDAYQAIHALRLKGLPSFCPLFATSSSQALTSSLTTLKMPTVISSDVWDSFSSLWYSTTAGVITAQQAMSNVEVTVALQLTSGVSTDVTDIQLLVNGTQHSIVSVLGSTPTATFKIVRLARGSTLEVKVAQSASKSLSGSSNNKLVIVGSV